MRRPSKGLAPKIAVDSQRLVSLAQALTQASSRLEERHWERHLDTLIEKLLKSDRQATIDAALDHLFKMEPDAYDALMESIETGSASCVIEHDGARFDALLVAVPILAWTRFSIASGPISSEALLALSAHLYGHVLAADAKLAMSPNLFAIDQLPRTHADAFQLTHQLAQAALTGRALRPLVNPPETAPFLADTRYLLATIVVPAGAPIFRWQMSDVQALDVIGERRQALAQWRAQAMPTVEKMVPGCGVELLLPEAYYVACREADKQIRPASIRAAVHYLVHALAVTPGELSAIVGGFVEDLGDGRIDEYRIGFTLRQQADVVYGVVWPLYGEEGAEDGTRDDPVIPPVTAGAFTRFSYANPLREILDLLKQCDIDDVVVHDAPFPMEACDDCGAPLYSDRHAELVHAEMPVDAPQTTEHFH